MPARQEARSFFLFPASARLRRVGVYLPALACLALLAAGLLYPLLLLVEKSVSNMRGEFVGAANLITYFQTPGLVACLYNTLIMGFVVTGITVLFAIVLAYASTHTHAPGKKALAVLTLLPLFVPSIFPALGLIYLFGAQGLLKDMLGGHSLYGPLGIVLGGVVYALPHACLLITAAMRDIDRKLYLAAQTLGAGPWRRFFTVTLPGARYGIVSAGIVVFVLTITDFGVPKVLGGDYAMLATEVFKQVVGLQNFTMGATVSLVLLLPSVVAFALDAWARKKQRFLNRGGGLSVARDYTRDAAFGAAAWVILLLPTAVMGMVVWGSLVGFWPYDMSLTLQNYAFEESVYGAAPYWNSLLLALSVAVVGTLFVFCGAYALERCKISAWAAIPYRLLALAPLCVPGTVLGLAYVLAFNRPDGLSGLLYGSLGILAFNSIIHFYTVSHLACTGGLARLDPQYEKVGATLGRSRFGTFLRVILPLQKNTLMDVLFYFFVNALTTISAVVFLYSPDTIPASVAILQMADTGRIAEASAMGTLILLTALAARVVVAALSHYGEKMRLSLRSSG